MFIAGLGLPLEKTIWQVKPLKAPSSSFSFYRASELFGSLNCISELSLKKKVWNCSIYIAAFLLQVVIHPVVLLKPKNELRTKKKGAGIILSMFVPPQFLLKTVRAEIVNCKVSPRAFLVDFHVLVPKGDRRVQTCGLVEVSGWAQVCPQKRGVQMQGCCRLAHPLLLVASRAASQQPAGANPRSLASIGVC